MRWNVTGALIGLLALGGCSSGGGDGYGGGPIPNPPPAPPPPPSPTNAVDVLDDRFSPVSASVNANTAVTWTWRGNGAHNVTFEDGQGSATDKVSGSHQRTFVTGGTYRYRCTNHSNDFSGGMSGSIVVN